MTDINLKQQISEILVKWSMPTRQVAINEILALFLEMSEEVIKTSKVMP